MEQEQIKKQEVCIHEKRDTRSRSWMLTQSADKITQDELINALSSYVWVGQLEQGEKGGEQGYLHYQIYIENPTQIRFSTLKKLLPTAHIEEKKRNSTKLQCYDYVTKTNTAVGEKIGNGVINLVDEQGKRTDLKAIVEMLDLGFDLDDIRKDFPTQFLMYQNRIRAYVNSIQEEKQKMYLETFRIITTTYIWGDTGIGKTRYVMEKYGYKNVYRVGSYGNSMWDKYMGEKVVIFEEFRGDIKIGDFLKMTEGYPFWLPARYQDKLACFDTIYIISNEPLFEQYKNVQQERPKTFEAFKRRINYVWELGKTTMPLPLHGKLSVEQITMLGAVDENIFSH